MVDGPLHTVTGAGGYTGRYITALLLERGCRVQTLTGRPALFSAFGGRVKAYPLDFCDMDTLAGSLAGTDTLFNTYWARFPWRGLDHDGCVANSAALFEAARRAGVRRVVHVSIVNADVASPLSYYRGKGLAERALRASGLSYAILRPTVLYGLDDILLSNIAWTVKRFPVVLLPGRGDYGIQPVFVEDFARMAVAAADGDDAVELDVVGPEVFSYRDLVCRVRAVTGAKCAVWPAPRRAAWLAAAALGLVQRDVVLTWEEVLGLSRGLLVSGSAGNSEMPTKLSCWLEEHGPRLGLRYASELARRR